MKGKLLAKSGDRGGGGYRPIEAIAVPKKFYFSLTLSGLGANSGELRHCWRHCEWRILARSSQLLGGDRDTTQRQRTNRAWSKDWNSALTQRHPTPETIEQW